MRAAALVLVGLVACWGGDKDGQGPVVDAAPSTTGVTFVLSFQSDIPESIFVQSGTELGGQGWLTVRAAGGAHPLPILDDCGRCNCDRCDPCAVCGVGLPEVTEIPSGEKIEWGWDAHVYGPGTCATTGDSCETTTPLAPGEYVARFCWSFTSDGVGPGHHVGPLTCADEPLRWPPPAGPPPVVEHHLCACG